MYELRQVGEKTYYVDCPTRIGIFDLGGGEAALIDSGNSGDVAKKLLKLLDGLGLRLRLLLLTHAHADHSGGAALLHRRTGCAVYCAGLDRYMACEPVLEPVSLYGGCPPRALRGHALMAAPVPCLELTESVLPDGLTLQRLDGHSFAQTAIGTADGIWFLGDALTSDRVLEKYCVSFLYDVEAYLHSLDAVAAMQGRLFVPAHAQPVEDVVPLVEKNRTALFAVHERLLELTAEPLCFDELLGRLFDACGMTMDLQQYALVGSTVRSHLAWLCDQGKMTCAVVHNRLLWQRV